MAIGTKTFRKAKGVTSISFYAKLTFKSNLRRTKHAPPRSVQVSEGKNHNGDNIFLTEVIYNVENKSTQFQHYLRLIIDTHTIETLPSPRVLEKVVCSRCSATSDILGHLLACVAWRFWLGTQSK